jgi:hypothetical protein
MDACFNDSSYGAGRNREQFGLKLEDYPSRVERIVRSLVVEIRSKLSAPTNLFFPILERLAKERHSLANEQKTPNAYLFGLRRDSDAGLENGPIFVSDVEGYYNELFSRKIVSLLTKGCMDAGKTVFEWESVSPGVLYERQQAVFRHPALKHLIARDTKKSKFADYCPTNDPQGRREFYQLFLEVYRQNHLPPSFIQGDSCFFGTLSYRRNGALVLLSQYLGSYSKGLWKDLLLIHHPFFSIQETLYWIEELFIECIQWDPSKQGIEDLKKKIAMFSYLFSHCMPFGRGSAAIREWLEMGIFRFHGHKVVDSNMSAIDMEAFTSFQLEDFLTHYGL